MDNQFNTLKNHSIDPNTEYYMNPVKKAKGWTNTMKYSICGEYVFLKNLIDTLQYLKEPQLVKHIVNQQNDQGWTPLMLACRHASTYSNINTIKLLLANGADINLQNSNGSTALIIACEYSNTDSNNEVVQLLLDNGADINLTNFDKQTPLMYAVVNSATDSNKDTVKLLLENKADVNVTDVSGTTALMFASDYSIKDSHLEIVKLLLEYKADVNIIDNKNMVAFTYAFNRLRTKQDNIGVLKLLADHGTHAKFIINLIL